MTEPTKAPAKSNFAIIILVVFGVLALLAIPVLLFGIFAVKRNSASKEHHAEADLARLQMMMYGSTEDAHVIHFKEGFRPRSVEEIGDELSRESFVEFTIDSNATSLSREAFIKKAKGRKVRWLMRVNDITTTGDGGLSGQFDMPYMIQNENGGATGSAVSIHASFPSTEEGALTRLSRNDWVTIEGQLELRSGYVPSLLDAKVVEGK